MDSVNTGNEMTVSRSDTGTNVYADTENTISAVKSIDENVEKNGKGEWRDGEKYLGDFKDHMRDGKGELTWPDGRKYIGDFKDGKCHGKGQQTFPNGEKYVGCFQK